MAQGQFTAIQRRRRDPFQINNAVHFDPLLEYPDGAVPEEEEPYNELLDPNDPDLIAFRARWGAEQDRRDREERERRGGGA